MKYLIQESRLKSLIIDYLNSTFPVDEINWNNDYDEDGNDDYCAASFYKGDYIDGETQFRWYDECYWNRVTDEWRKKDLMDNSPILEFEDEIKLKALNGYFGDAWKPVFREWFMENFDYRVNKIK